MRHDAGRRRDAWRRLVLPHRHFICVKTRHVKGVRSVVCRLRNMQGW